MLVSGSSVKFKHRYDARFSILLHFRNIFLGVQYLERLKKALEPLKAKRGCTSNLVSLCYLAQ